MSRLSILALTAAALALTVFAALLMAAHPVDAAAPRSPARLTRSIEPLAAYVEQDACDPHVRPGTAKLGRLLAATYRSGRSWNSTYACGTDGTRSEHYDGRAIDWMVSVRNRSQHAAAKAAIAWLLATDRAGNRFAMARRLGVMYLIYDNRIWGAWDGKWEPYNNCSHRRASADDNACHRTHVHISLSWNGAMGRTSFWTNRVAPTNYGPCRAMDLNWAPRYVKANPHGCPSHPLVRPKRGASTVKVALVTYSGAAVRRGWRGPAVSAVQRAVHVRATGSYTSATVRAVKHFQAKHRCPVTGAMNAPTWRALLAAVR